MSDYIGTREQVDEYVGSRLLEAAYLGSRKYYDAYSEVSGSLPLTYESRIEHILKNYVLYGTSEGAGVQTENLFDYTARDPDKGFVAGARLLADGSYGAVANWCVSEYISITGGETYTWKWTTVEEPIQDLASLGFYDANKTFLLGVAFRKRPAIPAMAPQNASYIRVSFLASEGTTLLDCTLTSGSTAPTTFIPFGYKIPILLESKIVTDNLFDKNATDTNNGYVDGYHLKNDGTTGSNSSWAISEYMPITGGLKYTFDYGSLSSSPAICYYDSNKHFISGVPYGGQSPKTVSVPRNTSYIRFSFMKSYVDDIMFVQANSLPNHYIPHFYQSNYDLMIGSTKLGEEEYLDYESGKVYKRTENDFPFAEKGTFAFGDDGNIISDGEGKFVISIPSTIPANTRSELIPLNRPYTIPQSVDTGGEFTFYVGNNVAKTNMLLVFYDAYGVQIENWSCSPSWRKSTAYQNMTGKTIAYIGLRTNNSVSSDDMELTPMFSKNADLTSYIPYLQPTDPPIALPEILTYQGEDTLSSTETLGEATIRGRIKKITLVTPDLVQGSIDYWPYTIGQKGTRTSVTTRCSTQSYITIPSKSQVYIYADKDDVVFSGCWTDTNLTYQGNIASGFNKLVLENTELSDKYIVLNSIGRMLPTDKENSPTGTIVPSYFTITFKIKKT